MKRRNWAIFIAGAITAALMLALFGLGYGYGGEGSTWTKLDHASVSNAAELEASWSGEYDVLEVFWSVYHPSFNTLPVMRFNDDATATRYDSVWLWASESNNPTKASVIRQNRFYIYPGSTYNGQPSSYRASCVRNGANYWSCEFQASKDDSAATLSYSTGVHQYRTGGDINSIQVFDNGGAGIYGDIVVFGTTYQDPP